MFVEKNAHTEIPLTFATDVVRFVWLASTVPPSHLLPARVHMPVNRPPIAAYKRLGRVVGGEAVRLCREVRGALLTAQMGVGHVRPGPAARIERFWGDRKSSMNVVWIY